MNIQTLDGWAINRIPAYPQHARMFGPLDGGIRLVSISDIVLEDDYIEMTRIRTGQTVVFSLKQ